MMPMTSDASDEMPPTKVIVADTPGLSCHALAAMDLFGAT